MKLNTTPRVGVNDPVLQREIREHAVQVNLLSEGRIAAAYNASTAAPATGAHLCGDYLRNSEPSELGAAGNKYFVDGWTCIASGNPGTWVERRILTGN